MNSLKLKGHLTFHYLFVSLSFCLTVSLSLLVSLSSLSLSLSLSAFVTQKTNNNEENASLNHSMQDHPPLGCSPKGVAISSTSRSSTSTGGGGGSSSSDNNRSSGEEEEDELAGTMCSPPYNHSLVSIEPICQSQTRFLDVQSQERGGDEGADGIPTIPPPSIRGQYHPQQQTQTQQYQQQTQTQTLTQQQYNHHRQQQRRRQRRGLFGFLDSGLWRCLELFSVLSQIMASIVVLMISQDEDPDAPLPLWIAGYAIGCAAMIPIIYWRYMYPSNRQSLLNMDMDMDNTTTNVTTPSTPLRHQQTSSSPLPPLAYPAVPQLEDSTVYANHIGMLNPHTRASMRLAMVMERFRVMLDCFFAVWFVVGNVWVFGRNSSMEDSPHLFRLCVVFLSFSCVSYAMPFVLCTTVCCCLPCIITLLGIQEDAVESRGASPELIAALPTYKFKAKGGGNKEKQSQNDSDSDSSMEAGIIAAGTEKERSIAAEDATCCICLRKYKNNSELRELPCSHFFHVDCVDQWLRINASCPLCKYTLDRSTDEQNDHIDIFSV